MSQVMNPPRAATTIYPVIMVASLGHFINDVTQALLPASYPVLKTGFDLSFAQLGVLTFVYQITASILQPFVGWYTDGRPQPYSLPFGMICSCAGMITLGMAPNYPTLLMGAILLGFGSSIFHPEASRIARLASGGKHGFAQSLFQVGGNFGTSLGPLLAAFFILPHGQHGMAALASLAFAGILILAGLGRWYQLNGGHLRAPAKSGKPHKALSLSRARVGLAIAVLIALIFSKYFYLASFTSYYNFYLMARFGVTERTAQLCQFVFFAAVAVGTMVGGPVGDRIGRKKVIWGSILGILPFTVVLPHANLETTIILSAIIGTVIASAFSAIVVYAQELLPGRVGMVSGLFFGFAFGMGGIGAAALGVLADHTSIEFVFELCAFLPLIGLLTILLPNVED
ncbi:MULTISPECIES: MFS transporter [unclassified Rhizobium]|uniref:MFS transporter n=1 Tax=unclassified Rhizobium TaxID=2613769 RepID=UPI00084CDB44|nr:MULTISPECIES: MFS transporter [unclassified Rhizobium]OEC96000.1 Fosmidomycin resistance protein [Rhizobium sp. YK2]QYA16206.1 MFS transporter [Rhizobium sp. AB2/73]UEQ84749.1 MFS transporter [Rhizobium sp. AB2/73]